MIEEAENWIEFGKEVLEIEASSIRRAALRIGTEFCIALDLLDRCRGKVITTGVGKSGVAARKVASTLTSTGCPALFLHPSEAMHGDLGIVAPEDLVLILSHSGESEEVVSILPTLLARGVTIIALVGNLQSVIAKRANVVLDASIEREACPLNLAPTTSVVVALALGDALAMTLQRKRNFNAQDYALNHPGGRLGRRLTLRVSDVMPVGAENLPYVEPEATFQDVLYQLTAGHLGAVCVLDAASTLVGIIAESDLRQSLRKGAEAFELCAGDMMNPNPVMILNPDQLAYSALEAMTQRTRPISVAPVVDGSGRCVGMLRVNDLVRAGL